MTLRRNIYAKIRTLMANERTLMSYYRAALALIGIGAFVFKFYDGLFARIFAGVFGLIGVALAIYGTIKFLHYRNRIMKK